LAPSCSWATSLIGQIYHLSSPAERHTDLVHRHLPFAWILRSGATLTLVAFLTWRAWVSERRGWFHGLGAMGCLFYPAILLAMYAAGVVEQTPFPTASSAAIWASDSCLLLALTWAGGGDQASHLVFSCICPAQCSPSSCYAVPAQRATTAAP
jgi:hypothetical protein